MFDTYFVGFSTYSEGVPDGDEEANELDGRLSDLELENHSYRLALEALPGDLRFYFPMLRDDQLEEAEELFQSYYRIGLEKNRREEIRLKERLAEKRIYR